MSKILYIDKPKGITSFDLCFKLRKVFNTKKIGHTGTLDPNATGLMVCLIDGASKTNQFLVSANKEYIATVKLGIRTDSEDIDGNVLEEKEEVMPSFELIVETIKSFIGKSEQIPPMASAMCRWIWMRRWERATSICGCKTRCRMTCASRCRRSAAC